MNRFMKFLLIFLTGAISYSLIEILWRGYTHISMFFAGGICFFGLYIIQQRVKGALFLKCFLGSVLITAVEFLSGVAVNLVLNLRVWDYSGMPLNLMGQICLVYSCIWFVLCIPAFALCRYIDKVLNGAEINSIKNKNDDGA